MSKLTFDFLKNNLAILILVPTITGAAVQQFQLTIIDSRYYKYFSISQCIIDGSYILYQLVILILISATLNSTLNWYEQYLLGKAAKKKKTNRKSFYLIPRLFLAIALYFILFIASYRVIIPFPNSREIIIFILPVVFLMGIYYSLYRNKIILRELYQAYRKRITPNMKSGIMTTFTLYVIYFVLVTRALSDRISYPSFNINSFKSEVIFKLKNVEDVEILYVNDKYVITRIQKTNCLWEDAIFENTIYDVVTNNTK